MKTDNNHFSKFETRRHLLFLSNRLDFMGGTTGRISFGIDVVLYSTPGKKYNQNRNKTAFLGLFIYFLGGFIDEEIVGTMRRRSAITTAFSLEKWRLLKASIDELLSTSFHRLDRVLPGLTGFLLGFPWLSEPGPSRVLSTGRCNRVGSIAIHLFIHSFSAGYLGLFFYSGVKVDTPSIRSSSPLKKLGKPQWTAPLTPPSWPKKKIYIYKLCSTGEEPDKI